MKRTIGSIFAALLMASSASAFAAGMTVNNVTITQEQVNLLVNMLVAQGNKDSDGLRKQVAEELATREIIAQAAVKLGLDKGPDAQAALANVRRDALVQMYRNDFMRKHPATDAETQALYEQQKKEAGTMEYHLAYIVVNSEADAKAVYEAAKKGDKFEALAKSKSLDEQTKANGGDIGWQLPAALGPMLGGVISKVGKGQVTEPVQSQMGWAVFKVIDTRAYQFPAYEKIKPMLQQQVQSANLMRSIADMRKGANVKF